VSTSRRTRSSACAPVLLSVSEAAREFGYHRQTIAKRIAELGIRPSGTRNGHPVYRVRDLLRIERTRDEGAGDPDALEPLVRRAHYQAETQKLRVNRTRGQLLERPAADREFARVVDVVLRALAALPAAVADAIAVTPPVREALEHEMEDIAARVTAMLENAPQSQPEGAPDASPQDSDLSAAPAAP